MSSRDKKLHSWGFTLICVFILAGAFLTPANAKIDNKNFMLDHQVLAGNLYLKSGNIADAINEFETAEKSNPENIDILMGLVRAYSRKGDFDRAGEKLGILENKFPFDMRVTLVKGEYLAQKGHAEEASYEFISLIEKGIYRFEATQALIDLYANTHDEVLKPIIETTIGLYETENQVLLYKILSDKLIQNGWRDEAASYRRISASLLELEQLDGQASAKVESDPIEIVVKEVEGLMQEGSYEVAEVLLTDATKRWPGDQRIQKLLKSCYMNMIADVPMNLSMSVTGDSDMGKTLAATEQNLSTLSNLDPEKLNIQPESKDYLKKIKDIDAKSETYFNKMLDNFTALNARVKSNVNSGEGCNPKAYQSDIKEARLLLQESLNVLNLETEALKTIKPPKNFETFHESILGISNDLIVAFKDLDNFAATFDWGYYNNAMVKLQVVDAKNKKLTDVLKSAVEEDAVKPAESEPEVSDLPK